MKVDRVRANHSLRLTASQGTSNIPFQAKMKRGKDCWSADYSLDSYQWSAVNEAFPGSILWSHLQTHRSFPSCGHSIRSLGLTVTWFQCYIPKTKRRMDSCKLLSSPSLLKAQRKQFWMVMPLGSLGTNLGAPLEREGKVLRVLLSGRWLPRNQG